MTRDDDPLLLATARVLKREFGKLNDKIAALEARCAGLERELNLAKRIEVLEQRAALGEQARRWDS